jgi:hypothetical protein
MLGNERIEIRFISNETDNTIGTPKEQIFSPYVTKSIFRFVPTKTMTQ